MGKINFGSIFRFGKSENYDCDEKSDKLSSRAAFVQVRKIFSVRFAVRIYFPIEWSQIIVSLLASLSGIASGMGLGYPAITSQLLMREGADVILTQSQVSWFASVTAITGPIGGPLSGYLSDKIGRRNTLMVTNIVAIVSWAIIGFSSREDAENLFVQLLVARALIGVTIGMSSGPAVMYVSEVCHPKLRGRLTLLSSPFFTALGLLLIYFLGNLIPVSWKFSRNARSENSHLDRLQIGQFGGRRNYSRDAFDFLRPAGVSRVLDDAQQT